MMPGTVVQPYRGSYLMPSLEYATVSDAAHPGIISCDPEASLTEVARLMATHHVHCVAVIGTVHDDARESLVWGIVSDLDLLEKGLGAGAEATARSLVGQTVVSVEPSMPLADAAELMHKRRVSHLVVTEAQSKRPVGILSTLDIAGILAWGQG
jgi:CBS domain-containing protein